MTLRRSRIGLALLLVLLASTIGACASVSDVGASDPSDPSDPLAPSSAPATVVQELTVDSPLPGEVFPSPSTIRGTSSTEWISFRLTASGLPLIEGTMPVDDDGTFAFTVDFENTCCIEMLLEVFQRTEGGLAVEIPVAYPENEPGA